MDAIKPSIWAYQRNFRRSVQYNASKLVELLDEDLVAETFLLGLPRDGKAELHPVCLEPEECGWTAPEFSSVRTDADALLALEIPSGQTAGGSQRRRRAAALHAAVIKALRTDRAEPAPESLHFSGFLPVKGYDVGIVLVIKHRRDRVHYSLPRTPGGEERKVPVSLIGAAAQKFLSSALGSLYVPFPENIDVYRGNSQEEILKKAASGILEAHVFAGGGMRGLYGLFNACNYIASMKYEGADSKGGMIIAREYHPNIAYSFKFENPVSLSQPRSIRKLLEVTSAGASLITDGAEVFGVGDTVEDCDPSSTDLLHLRFTAHYRWELIHAGNILFQVNFGIPKLPTPPLDRAKFSEALEIIFGHETVKDARQLYRLALEACRQRHGTVMILTPAAEDEAGRLSKQSTKIEPIAISPDLIGHVTAIDGAVLLDLDGVCHSIGVILDGEAVPHGDPGRGARFNSSLRYVSFLKAKGIASLAVIVSEDGTSELYPDLPSRMSRRELDAVESQLAAMDGDDLKSLASAHKLLKWCDDHRFYLPSAHCELANRLEKWRRVQLSSTGEVYLRFEKFTPDPEMSENFLF